MKWLTHGHATRLWQWQKAGYYLLWSDALSWCHPFAWLATRSNSDFSLMSPGTNTRLVNGMTCMLPKFLPFNIRAIFVTHLVMLGCLSGRISGYVHLIYFKTSKGWCHRFMGWHFFFSGSLFLSLETFLTFNSVLSCSRESRSLLTWD